MNCKNCTHYDEWYEGKVFTRYCKLWLERNPRKICEKFLPIKICNTCHNIISYSDPDEFIIDKELKYICDNCQEESK